MKKFPIIVLILVMESGLILSLSGCQSGGITPEQTTSVSPSISIPTPGSVVVPRLSQPPGHFDSSGQGKVYSVQIDLVPSKLIYLPGETISMETTLTNVSSGQVDPVMVSPLPPVIMLTAPWSEPNTTLYDARNVVKTFPEGTEQKLLTIGDKVTYSLIWDQKDDLGNQVPPGWYSYESNFKFHPVWSSGSDIGTGTTKPAFLIQYPQGAMQKNIELNQIQKITGFPLTTMDGQKHSIDLVLTLKQVILNEKGASFFVTASSPNNPVSGYNTPEWIRGIRAAQYEADGAIRYARWANTQASESGLDLKWGYDDNIHLDPVPGDAKQLTFTITQFGDCQGNYEFNIPLQGSE